MHLPHQQPQISQAVVGPITTMPMQVPGGAEEATAVQEGVVLLGMVLMAQGLDRVVPVLESQILVLGHSLAVAEVRAVIRIHREVEMTLEVLEVLAVD
jgi:hypothetical protein